jgi:hypothetical protein
MPKLRKKFFSGPWTLVADPPPCDPGNPRRALAYCKKARHGQRCTCLFDLGSIVDDLEEVGLDEYASEFEDELEAESLEDVVAELMRRVRGRPEAAATRLQEELMLLHKLAAEGSGVRPGDEE